MTGMSGSPEDHRRYTFEAGPNGPVLVNAVDTILTAFDDSAEDIATEFALAVKCRLAILRRIDHMISDPDKPYELIDLRTMTGCYRDLQHQAPVTTP